MASNSSLQNTFISRVSRRLVISYVLDWITIFAMFGIGGAFNSLDARYHAFSIIDPTISFPYTVHETISTLTLLLVSIVAPGLVIVFVCLVLVPGPTAARSTPKALLWRRKLWEINTGLLGLGVALGGAFVITEGLKDLFGKPRPDFISRCDPDLSNIPDHVVGGLSNFLAEAPPIVAWTICRNKSKMVSHDGFASFPSGHSSFSWSGMGYLTLFLCAKFGIAVPWLAPRGFQSRTSNFLTLAPKQKEDDIPLRNRAAAPPVPHLVLALIPLAVAAYIASTRWADYRHHGFDIICGSILGFVMAWLGFRWYHLPIRQGSGWAWGARTRGRAFGVEVGVRTYVGDEGWERAKWGRRGEEDVEGGGDEPALTSGGLADVEQGTAEGATSLSK